jgi:ribosomal protein S18 acetylase RimI-like enzyme
MDTELSDIVRLNKSQAKPAAEMLSRAFHNDPGFLYYFPDELKRKKMVSNILSFTVGSGIRYGETYATSPNLEGIAIWISSDDYPITSWKMVHSVSLLTVIGFGLHGGFGMKGHGKLTDAMHKRLAPSKHWFLHIIGVDPQFQGKGYAGKLLRTMLNRIDKEGLPCYLDTLNEDNVPLYEHFGFKLIEKVNIPQTTLTNWAMLREVT